MGGARDRRGVGGGGGERVERREEYVELALCGEL
jgi:hypothetical protein